MKTDDACGHVEHEWREASWSERIGFVLEAAAYLAALGVIGFYIYILAPVFVRVFL